MRREELEGMGTSELVDLRAEIEVDARGEERGRAEAVVAAR